MPAPKGAQLDLLSALYFDERGVVIGADRRHVARGDAWRHFGLNSIQLGWDKILQVSDAAVFPNVEITAYEPTIGAVRYSVPLSERIRRSRPPNDVVRSHVEGFLRFARAQRCLEVVAIGWSVAPNAEWRPVGAMPGLPTTAAAGALRRRRGGPFRDPRSEAVLVRWKPTQKRGFAGLARRSFLFGRREHDRVEHSIRWPSEVAATDSHVFARVRGRVFRTERSLLRMRIERWSFGYLSAQELVFGACAELVLPPPAYEALRPVLMDVPVRVT